MVNLYLSDGTKILTVGIGMLNYELFCDVLRKKCPETVAVYYRSQVYESPQKRILRYGTEYYILAGLGFSSPESNSIARYSSRIKIPNPARI